MKNLAHMTNYKTMGLTYNRTILLDKKKKKRGKKNTHKQRTHSTQAFCEFMSKGETGRKKTIFFCLYHSRFIAECACENSVCDISLSQSVN